MDKSLPSVELITCPTITMYFEDFVGGLLILNPDLLKPKSKEFAAYISRSVNPRPR